MEEKTCAYQNTHKTIHGWSASLRSVSTGKTTVCLFVELAAMHAMHTSIKKVLWAGCTVHGEAGRI